MDQSYNLTEWGGLQGGGKNVGSSNSAMPAFPDDAAESMDAAREGARDGTAVATSSVVLARWSGQEKTGTRPIGKFDEGKGVLAERRLSEAMVPWLRVSASQMVFSAKASISSAEDCVILAGREVVANKV